MDTFRSWIAMGRFYTSGRAFDARMQPDCDSSSWLPLVLAGLLFAPAASRGHDIITTTITWDREIARIVNARCASCHRAGGSAFSLMSYAEGRPWAEAIKEEVLSRRMPPWGAVKGFGDFRNDQALSSEELERIVSWADGGAPEGDAKDFPPPPKFDSPAALPSRSAAIPVKGRRTLTRAIVLDGLMPRGIPDKASFQVVAELPDGSVQPLVWVYEYKAKFAHPFLFRTPIDLPACTVIAGVPANAAIDLLPVSAPSPTPGSALPPAHRNAPCSPRPGAGTAPRRDTPAPAEK